MTRKPTGAAARLAGLAEAQASGLLEDAAMIEDLPKPDSYTTLAQRVRLRGAIARSGVALHKLQDQEDRRVGPQNQDEADMDDQTDDPETVERKYVELQDLVDRYARRAAPGAVPGDRAGGGDEHRPGQLAPPGERRAA
jgi:hypothetical protein